MKLKLSVFSIAVAAASSIALLTTESPASTAAASSPSPKPTATAAASDKSASNDACGATKSKWQHIQCEEFNSSAPGDEYFGRMKMSYLGIDNTYKDGSVSAGDYTTDQHLIAKLDFATEALRKWAAKYPNDPQLARSYFLAVVVLRKVYTQQEQELTWQFMQLLAQKYPNTYFGKTMKAQIASGGFTEHWFVLAQICPTPLPKGVHPENTPDATPTPSPAPGHPAVALIVPPCVEPSPEASEYPSMSAFPTPSSSPLPHSSSSPLPGPPKPPA
jgi:hypothetical protein